MKQNKSRKKHILIILISILTCIALAVMGLKFYSKKQMEKIPDLSFMDALEYTTKGNKDAVITVGIIKDGEMSYTVYGENGKILSDDLHIYEIGSLTKTFTAALVWRAVEEGKIDVNATIDEYLSLPKGKHYPTILELLTHTSGYNGDYFETPMIKNFFARRNPYYGISKEMAFNKVSNLDLNMDNYDFEYSNFGYAVLGLILEVVYETDYTSLLNNYAKELELFSTKVSKKDGDLGNYWDWSLNDAYIPAGAVTSNIEDMLKYAQMQLDGDSHFTPCHDSQKVINASTDSYKMMDIHMDEIGLSWIIDTKNGFIWHNGGTWYYNSYLGFCPDTQTAVVILSNLPPGERIPSTVLGIKLLKEIQ